MDTNTPFLQNSMAQYYTIPLFYTGRDFVASWTRITHPPTASLYGNIMESWWSRTTYPTNPTPTALP